MDNKIEDSDSEEEILVFANFKDLLDQDVLKPGNLQTVKAIGMDSEAPVIQLNNLLFRGEYSTCLGTQLLFENDPDPAPGDGIFDMQPDKQLKYFCKTRKVLNMKRIFLRPKEGVSGEEGTSTEPPEQASDYHASSIEEALQNFKVYFDENDVDLPVSKPTRAPGFLKFQKPARGAMVPKILSLKDISDDELD